MPWDKDLDKNTVTYKIAATDSEKIRVIAGPGTGKSFAMKRRVARLLEANVNPRKILAVTFTRVAAEDLHRELQKLEVSGCEELEGQTLHGLAMQILSRKHVLASVGRIPRPLNKFELNAMYADLSPEHEGKKACKKFVAAYEAAWAQSQGDEPGFAKTSAEKAFQKDLLDWLDFHQGMLIGEVIPYLVKFLKENPKAEEHSEYEHLLIDEYQDLNKAEQTALSFLGAKAKTCVVGDDDQSIYSFKKAHPDGIRQWKALHEACDDFEMADCRRCPTSVVDIANSLISHNVDRTDRQLVPIEENGKGEIRIIQLSNPEAEANWIAKTIAELLKQDVHPSEIIVLIQRSKAANKIIESLRGRNVPAKSYYEESQLESEAAQKRFSLFKLFLNSEDRVALRYLLGCQSTTFSAGPYARLRAHCEEAGDTPWQALDKILSNELKLKHAGGLPRQFEKIKKELALVAQAESLMDAIDILFPNQEDLLDLRELALACSEDASTPKELFSAMMKEITQPDIPPTVDEVRVMSLHKSKGLSSPYVFIAGCVQGLLPQIPDATTSINERKAQLEEARRLLFVAITRVKADPKNKRPGSLFITFPKEMYAGLASASKISYTKIINGYAQLFPSRFLSEFGEATPTFESA